MSNEFERQNAEPSVEQKMTAAPKAAPKKSRGKKIAHSLVVASAVAVMTVYSAGYIVTQSAASQIAAQATPPAALVQTAPSTPGAPSTRLPGTTSNNVPGTSPSASSATAASTAGTATSTSAYKDGTYTGVGSSRHGSIQATVIVQNGKIVSAQITGSSTRYPTSRIASLPAQVVSKQSAKVNYVSGATDSSVAYVSAVASALSQAA